MSTGNTKPVDAEVVDAEPKHLIRHPGAPTNLNELAGRKGEAVEIIEARVQVVETLRRASIRLTSPADWLLFKAPDDQGGQIVGYCQDSGAERFRDLWGIDVFDVSDPEKITGNDANVFTYIVRGSGRCRITGQTLEQIEGARSSTDDFCRGVTGVALEVLVRKAARANLDGGVTRELAGMKSVPVEEIAAAWEGTPKKIEACRHGRGFGTRDERLGARSEKAPDVDPPVCPHCGSTGVFREGKNGRPGFLRLSEVQDVTKIATVARRRAGVGRRRRRTGAAARRRRRPRARRPPLRAARRPARRRRARRTPGRRRGPARRPRELRSSTPTTCSGPRTARAATPPQREPGEEG
jgi:hypothetical protein